MKKFETFDKRIQGVTLSGDTTTTLILNVYFPVNAPQNEQLISTYLGKLHAMTMQHNGPVVILGDFNISPRHANFHELVQLCDDAFVDRLKLSFQEEHNMQW